MRILHFVETLSRNAGGLPVAVMELASALAEASSETKVAVVTSKSNGVDSPEIEGSDRVQILRGPDLSQSHRDSPVSVIHQHGLWAPLPISGGRFARRERLPLVLSPHGMLEPWALRHHRWRKRVAWMLYQRRNLGSAAVLVATSEAEAIQFRKLGLLPPIAILPLGLAPRPASPLDPVAVAAAKRKRQLLFLSRIHPKKGIDLLLAAWAGIDAPDWELIIAGNDDGGHQPALEAQAARLGLGNRVRFAGPLFGADKDTAFRRADLFVLPSHSENFGLVVPEALQYGLPVITTTGTPWRALSRDDCGWWVDPRVETIREALREALSLSDEERKAMGHCGAALVEREHRWPGLAERYLALYRWLAGEGTMPPDVRRE